MNGEPSVRSGGAEPARSVRIPQYLELAQDDKVRELAQPQRPFAEARERFKGILPELPGELPGARDE